MSFEDRPSHAVYDPAAALFMHAGTLLDTIGPEGYSGTFDLPLTPQAITTLHAHEGLDLRSGITATFDRRPLSLELGYLEHRGGLNVLGIAIPTKLEAGSFIEALVYERAEDFDVFIPFARTAAGGMIELDSMPNVDESYITDVLHAAKLTLPEFSNDPAQLKLTFRKLIEKARTYTMHRENTFVVDPVHEVSVTDTTNRFFEEAVRERGDIQYAKGRHKHRASASNSERSTGTFHYEQLVTLAVTKFDRESAPARPVLKRSIGFTALDHHIVGINARLEVDSDSEMRVTCGTNTPSVDIMEKFHDELADYEIGGVRTPYKYRP